MKKHEKTLVSMVVVGAALWIAGFVVGWYVNSRINETPSRTVTVQTAAPSVTFTSDGKEVSYAGQADKTALETLQAATAVDVKDSAYGTMVTGIHGVKAEDGKTYWAFYVNSAYANEGAGTYKAKSGDTITWKLEEIR